MMLNDNFLNHIHEADAAIRSRLTDYMSTESGVDRVARLPALDSFTINEQAHKHIVATGDVFEGEISITWTNLQLSIKFIQTLNGATEIPPPYFDAVRIESTQDGSAWCLTAAHLVTIPQETAVLDAFNNTIVTTTETYNVRSLHLEQSKDISRFHRITFQGGVLDGYPHEALSSDGTLAFNQVNTSIFGRLARVRYVSDGTLSADKLLSLTYDGNVLTQEELRSVYNLLSFFTGARLEIKTTEHFDKAFVRTSVDLFQGVPHSLSGTPPLDTDNRIGAAFASQFPALLQKIHSEMQNGFPWHAAFHHIQESYTDFPESAIKNLAVALDTIIEAHMKNADKDRYVSRNEYKALIAPLIDHVEKVAAEQLEPKTTAYKELADHIKGVLERENHRGTKEKREMFWKEFNIDTSDYKDVLAYRDKSLHTGHVLDYLASNDYLEVSRNVAKLRTLANRAILRRLGYSGPMIDFSTGIVVEVE